MFKNSRYQVLIWTSLFLFIFVISSFGQSTSEQILNYLKQAQNATGAPGISAAVAHKGEIVFSDGIGFAELDNRTPADGKTVHNIASISKIHAAVAVMQLVEQGKVDLDLPVQTYVPYFPQKQWPVTTRHILTHTSGIRHYRSGEFGPQRIKEKIHYDSLEAGIEVFKDDTLLFQPGTFWSYSSYASNLMQGIIETVSDMGFEEYLKKYVWQPAGMLATSFDVPERVVHKRGKGYVRNDRGIVINYPYTNVSYKYAGGGIISTAEDLVLLGMALNRGKLLKPDTLQKMMTQQFSGVKRYNSNGEPRDLSHAQALSWFIRTDAQERRFISHTGSVKGCRSYFLNYPDEDLVVAIIANIGPFGTVEYGNAIAQLFLPPIHPSISEK